jgi:hypothetical protein
MDTNFPWRGRGYTQASVLFTRVTGTPESGELAEALGRKEYVFYELIIGPGLTLVSSVDSTLNLLYSSSQTRGLSHELTGNMAHLQYHHLMWAQRYYYAVASTWRPQLKPTDPAYSPTQLTKERYINKEEKKQRRVVFDRNAWGALGEVVRMAEGRDGVSLGRISFNERKA